MMTDQLQLGIVNKIMIGNWKKQPQTQNKQANSTSQESLFTDRLTEVVKLFKKKQDFYARILFIVPQPFRPNTCKHEHSDIKWSNAKMSQFQAQHEEMVNEEEQIIMGMKKFEKEGFSNNKTYLYSVFVRLLEVIDISKQKIQIKTQEISCRTGWEKAYDDNRSALSQCYQNLQYFQNYDIFQLLNVAKRKQNHRIYCLIPPKARKSQITLNPILRADSSKIVKRNSAEPSPSEKQKVKSIIAVKLGRKRRSKKVLGEKKEKKKQPFKQIYEILNIRNIKIEEREDMIDGQMDRNEAIRMERLDYREKLQLHRIYIKLSKRKKTEENKNQFS